MGAITTRSPSDAGVAVTMTFRRIVDDYPVCRSPNVSPVLLAPLASENTAGEVVVCVHPPGRTTRMTNVPAPSVVNDQAPVLSVVVLASVFCQMPSLLESLKTRQPDRPVSPASLVLLPLASLKTLP